MPSTIDRVSRTPDYRRLTRTTGVAGLAAVVLVLAPVVVGTPPEPAFTATAADFLTYYHSPTVGAETRSFIFTLGLVTLAWFLIALTILLRRAEGELPWRSAIATGSGVLFVAMVLPGGEVAAAFRSDDLDPQIARYIFDQSQIAFANGRVALASFCVCCGWVVLASRFFPRWVGLLVIISGAGLVISRVDRTSSLWLPFYLMFLLWIVVVAVILLRRKGRDGHPAG